MRGSRFFMSLRHECSTASHARSSEEGEEPPRGKYGAWVVMVTPYLRLPSSAFLQPVLSMKTSIMIQDLQGLPQSYYSLAQWVNIFQVLEAEALETPMLSPYGIKKAKK